MDTWKILLAAGGAALLVSCGPAPQAGESSQPALPPAAPPVDPVAAQRPADEAVFIRDVEQITHVSTDGAKNDIEAQNIKDSADSNWCISYNKLGEFQRWVGRIRNIKGFSADPNSGDPKSTNFEVDIGTTFLKSGDVYNDGTEIYRTVSNMKEGDPVVVSGTIDRSAEYSGCEYNSDNIDKTGLDVHYTSVEPLSERTDWRYRSATYSARKPGR